MSFDLNKIKYVDTRSKRIVFGFICESQTMLDADNPYYNIPDLVKYICFIYYHSREYFTVYGSNIVYEENTNTIRHIGGDGHGHSAYGFVPISDTMEDGTFYQWKFKILNYVPQRQQVCIGIDCSDKLHAETDFGYGTDGQINCGYGSAMIFYTTNQFKCLSNDYDERKCTFVQGDIFTIAVCVSTNHVVFKKNTDKAIILEGMNDVFAGNVFYVVVYLDSKGDCVQLLDFEIAKKDNFV
eukprot:28475_1